VRQAIRNAFQKGTPISIDPSLEAARRVRERILEVIPECQVLLASRPEIQALSECEDLESGIKVLQAKGTRIMGIKMGEQGCKVMFGDEQVDIPPMTGKKVIDTTGAGDSFNAGFVFGQLSGWSRANSARLGNALAYQVITSGKGIAGLRDPGEIANALKTA
jgi:sugar/nucleoside kinase (ribokinase family)